MKKHKRRRHAERRKSTTSRWQDARLDWLLKNRNRLEDVLFPRLTRLQIRVMQRDEVVARLRGLRDGWEALVGRGFDMGDARLAALPVSALRGWLRWFCSDENRITGVPHLLDALSDAMRLLVNGPWAP